MKREYVVSLFTEYINSTLERWKKGLLCLHECEYLFSGYAAALDTVSERKYTDELRKVLFDNYYSIYHSFITKN